MVGQMRNPTISCCQPFEKEFEEFEEFKEFKEFRSSGVQEFSVKRHAGLQAETVDARYGFHRAGTDVRAPRDV